MERNGRGVYFHPETNEIMRVGDLDAGPGDGDGWLRISEDDKLGLLAARKRVRELKLVEDETCVEWFGMRRRSPEAERDLSALVCRFKRDAEDTDEGSPGGSRFLDRMATRMKSLLGGPSGDSGPASPLAPARITVRAKEPRRRL